MPPMKQLQRERFRCDCCRCFVGLYLLRLPPIAEGRTTPGVNIPRGERHIKTKLGNVFDINLGRLTTVWGLIASNEGTNTNLKRTGVKMRGRRPTGQQYCTQIERICVDKGEL